VSALPTWGSAALSLCTTAQPTLHQNCEQTRSPFFRNDNATEPYSVEPKLLVLVQERFLWHFHYMERIQGVLDGGVKVLRGPLGLAALAPTRSSTATPARLEAGEIHVASFKI
jgi:hypothetical protein